MLYLDGLGKIIGEPFCKIGLSGSDHRICGQGNDHCIFRQQTLFLQFVKRLDSIHARHHMVQKNKIIAILSHELDRFLSGGCLLRLYTAELQQIPCHLQIHFIVIHYKHPGIRRFY